LIALLALTHLHSLVIWDQGFVFGRQFQVLPDYPKSTPPWPTLFKTNQAVKARKAKNTAEKQLGQGAKVESEAAELVRKAEAAKLAKDKELNRQKNAKANSKAIEAQIVELARLNRVEERGDIEFRYTVNGQIKTLMLQSDTRDKLIKGALNIVSVRDKHDIVPRAVAVKIAERDETAIVLTNSEEQELDDDYADYKVPDDLMW